jgi:hypothetical protein
MAERISKTVGGSGLVQTVDIDGTDMVVDNRQDITEAMEWAQALRNDDSVWQAGVKNARVHVAHIPDGVIHELLQIGVNVYTHPWKDIAAGLRKINREMCFTTRKQTT